MNEELDVGFYQRLKIVVIEPEGLQPESVPGSDRISAVT